MRSYLVRLASLLTAVLLAAPHSGAADDRVHARVINGSASLAAPAWIASLSAKGAPAGNGHFCGAALIRPQWLVTAAHCVDAIKGTPHKIQAVLGRRALDSSDGQVLGVEAIVVHPQANTETFANDIALVKLTAPVVGVAPVQLISAEEEAAASPGALATVLGWGISDPRYSETDTPIRPIALQEAAVPVIGAQQCRETMGAGFNPSQMICAGVLSSPKQFDGVDACYGDSGGPLVSTVGGDQRLLGVVSWGLECASDRYYGVYARVSAFKKWLESVDTAPPVIRGAPHIQGVPVVGTRLRCLPPSVSGSGVAYEYTWADNDSGEVIARKSALTLRPSDIGRRLSCEVTVANPGGSAVTRSRALAPVAPRSALRPLRVKGQAIRSAVMYCFNGKCQMLTRFSVNLRQLRAVAQFSRGSGPVSVRAARVTATEWAFTIDQRVANFSRLYLRAITADGSTLVEVRPR